MSHYLVTGAAGFIASRVIRCLVEEGHTVTGIDNLNEAYDVRMKHYRLEKMKDLPGLDVQVMDICDRPRLTELFKNARQPFDAVLNLAARAGVRSSVEDPWSYYNTNQMGTLNLLELCRTYHVQKFILASSSSVYGSNNPMPYKEDANTDLPLQPYAASKKAAEVLGHVYTHLYGLDFTVFRFFTVYGPAGRPDMVMFRFCQWISEGRTVHLNGDGEQSRGFTYLDDIARGVLLGLNTKGYNIFNLGGHEVITMNQLITMLETRLGKKAQIEHHPFHPADALGNLADVSKARAGLGWEPRVGLEDGVTNLVNWYLSERSWARDIRTD
ncbi:MAG TPA: GDP-mannose 4,6-dehydratase [Anaerolineaceae bacterium]|nr:GDP-mannose 4,6-dehydratase [Anaerolineaceae bacterium]HPN52455.1 GDP-mannose 4,6-dehydratase [Anaerolineaceae bacterium]